MRKLRERGCDEPGQNAAAALGLVYYSEYSIDASRVYK
jgi:hypothetical protein